LIKEGEMIWFTKGNTGEKVFAYLFQKVLLLCQIDSLPAKNSKSGCFFVMYKYYMCWAQFRLAGNVSSNELPLRLKAAEDFYDSSSTIQVTEFFDIGERWI